jgi:hypothetical protein
MLLLYSTNTWLAYMIAERYYNRLHYVWCSPYFYSNSVPSNDYANPPSATPSDIYATLFDEVRRGDRNSAKIASNRVKLLYGADRKREQWVISEAEQRDIAAIIDAANVQDFRPLLYVVPYADVSEIATEVPVDSRAHPLSAEYIIESLPRDRFDIIEFGV